MCSSNEVILKISQNSEENTCDGVIAEDLRTATSESNTLGQLLNASIQN